MKVISGRQVHTEIMTEGYILNKNNNNKVDFYSAVSQLTLVSFTFSVTGRVCSGEGLGGETGGQKYQRADAYTTANDTPKEGGGGRGNRLPQPKRIEGPREE